MERRKIRNARKLASVELVGRLIGVDKEGWTTCTKGGGSGNSPVSSEIRSNIKCLMGEQHKRARYTWMGD